MTTRVRPRPSTLPALAIVLAQLGFIWTLGLPATHDGFWHLNWVEAFNHALHEGWWYPRWYPEAFGGAGDPAYVFYPPLLRLFSVPFGLVSEVASVQLRGAVSLLLLLNLAGAVHFAGRLSLAPLPRAAWLAFATMHPYLLVNVFVRGAWPEAAAMAALWPLAIGLHRLFSGATATGVAWVAVGTLAMFLANNPSSLLLAYAGVPAALCLAMARRWRILGGVVLGMAAAGALAAFHLLPALFDQAHIRLGISGELGADRWPLWGVGSDAFSAGLFPIWAWLLAVAALALAALALRRLPVDRTFVAALIAPVLLALLLMLPASAPLYEYAPKLGLIQVPWRWLGTASMCALCLVALLAAARPPLSSRIALATIAAGLALAPWVLRAVEFIPQAQARLDALILCERQGQSCSRFRATGELAARGDGLAFAGQHATHYGPWMDDEGRPWRYDNFDYLPGRVDPASWPRPEGFLWPLPSFMPAGPVRGEPAEAVEVVPGERSARRWSFGLRLDAPARILVPQLRYVGWELSATTSDGRSVPVRLEDDARYRFELPAGRYDIVLRHVGTSWERAGTMLSLATALLLLAASALAWGRSRRG